MPLQKRRSDDLGPKKYTIVVHVISGLVVGWMIKTYFPEHTFLEVLGETWNWIFTAIAGMGGLAVVISLGVLIFNIYKWVVEHREKRKRR